MRQRIIDNLPRAAGDSDGLAPVRREQFLVYLMGPYRTFDVDAPSVDRYLPAGRKEQRET
jgi:hypothetical protein